MNIAQIEDSFQPSEDKKAAASNRGMVATSFPDATEAGVQMLAAGGNAVDAACAVGFALGVCDPEMSGIGGQTLGVLHVNGKTFAVDGSSRVPSLAHRSRVTEHDRSVGYRAATVPSTPATLAWLHRRYGRLEWPYILQSAIQIARDGYHITERSRALQTRELEGFLAVPSQSGAKYFLKNGREPYDVGDVFRQTELAQLLETLADKGVEEFYQGEIAAQIDSDMRVNDGFLRAEDLALIPWPVVRPVLRRKYRGVTVATMPPPGAGRTLLLVLLLLNHLDSSMLSGESHEKYHFVAESFRKAFLQRTERPFDPNTYPQIRDKRMLNRDFALQLAKSIASTIDPKLPVDPAGTALEELEETTHFSVMDSDGMAVSITQSVELAYGSKAAADGLGFLYNNYMMALDVEDPSHPYYLRPNAVPWSSAAPSVVFLEDSPWIAMGSPGSEQIYSSLAQFLMHIVDRSEPISRAVRRPRMHCSIGGTISLEAERFSPELVSYLNGAGYGIDERGPYTIGCVQAVLNCQTKTEYQGVADPRRDGTASGCV